MKVQIMKNLKQLVTSLVIVLFAITMIKAQDEATGMPGDHFSLYGALDLFKKSESLEQFEEMLNKKDNDVNNLDLNEDGEVDYIRVIDNMQNEAHAITLQVQIDKNEAQDIAVIAIEKTGAESATLQIIGDEEIFGEELVAEPYDEVLNSEGKGGPSADYEVTQVIVNVWFWPSVRWIYRPAYVAYASPWYWGNYPGWWRPWRPLTWTVFGPRTVRYRVGYRIAPTIRVTTARKIYAPRRTTSVTVVNRFKVNKTTYVTRKKTTVSKRGNQSAVVKKSTTDVSAKRGDKKVKASKEITTVKAKKGNTTVKKTTTKKVKKKKG